MSRKEASSPPQLVSGLPHVQAALDNPLCALLLCRESQTIEDKRVRARTLDIAAAIYAAAWTCEREPDEWQAVVRHANDHRLLKTRIRRDKDKNRTLEKCARIVFQFNHSYDRAYKMARALDYCSNKSIQPHSVRSFIKTEGGIEKLYSRALKELPRRGQTAGQREESRRRSRESGYFADLAGDDDDQDTPASSTVRRLDEVRDLVGVLDDHVLIKVKPEALQTLLNSRAGSTHLVSFRIGKTRRDGFLDLRADHVV